MSKKSVFTLPDFSETINDVVQQFLEAKQIENRSPATIDAYRGSMETLAKIVDFDKPPEELNSEDISIIISACKSRGNSDNTIAHYLRHLKTVSSWANKNGYTMIPIPTYKAPETVKPTYSDDDLVKLLAKPNMKKCNFAEYRNWVIVNFLIDTGCRAGSLLAIHIGDIDFDTQICQFRHNKTGKLQSVPLSNVLISRLRAYLKIRGGIDEDVLFPNSDGGLLTSNALKLAINHYNHSRGVSITSIHAFRHTFAKNYLLSGGDPFRLQKILNHSTLEMTKHYCKLYDKDIVEGFEQHSTLSRLQPHRIKMR